MPKKQSGNKTSSLAGKILSGSKKATQADAKKFRKKYRKTLESINSYPKKMNFFREHMLILSKK